MTIAALIHTIGFLLFWLTNLSFQRDVNHFLADATGLKVNFLVIFIFFSLFVGAWAVIRRMAKRSNKVERGFFHGISIFYLLFFYGSFIILFIKNPVQLPRLGQLMLYYRIFIDSALLFFAGWILRTRVKVSGWKKWLPPAGLFLLWLIPVFWTPGNVYRAPLPAKPLLIAHRGASQLAPENTIAAMERAAELGVFGVETDIAISRDGTLFLMHDSTLARTTNVVELYTTRVFDAADSFTWDEISKLNAGGWFIAQDPFHTVASGRVSADNAILYTREPVPTLSEMLRVVKDNNLQFIFDLRIPRADHPFASQVLDLCLGEIKDAGVAYQTWVLAGTADIPTVRAMIPDALLARGLDVGQSVSPEELIRDGYKVVNSEYGLSGRMINSYRKAGLWVNLWTVDEPWQYSRLWLAGADSVTSNYIKALIALPMPVMAMKVGEFLFLWGMVGLAVVGWYFYKTAYALNQH